MQNIDALIKLRQSGSTKVSKLPTGVLRYVLDYQYPNELCVRYSDTYGPIEAEEHTHFPSITKISYDNYLVAVNELPNRDEFQFTLLDGTNCGTKGSDNNWTSLQIS